MKNQREVIIIKLNIYKSKFDDLDKLKKHIKEVDGLNKDRKYVEVGEISRDRTYNTKLILFMEEFKGDEPDWHSEVNLLFKLDEKLEGIEHKNAIIVAETDENIYMVSLGRAYHKVSSLADRDFGLDFAERAINSSDFDSKVIYKAQSNITKEITSFREKQTELPVPNESYVKVTGKPIFENIYGSKVTCSESVKFNKNFPIRPMRDELSIMEIFNEIDETLVKDSIASFPRFNRIKEDSLLNDLYDTLLGMIKDSGVENNIEFNKAISIGGETVLVDGNIQVNIYLKNKKSQTNEEIEPAGNVVVDYINDLEITDSFHLNDVMFKLKTNDSSDISPLNFSEVIYVELKLENELYILTDGDWFHFNSKYLEVLNDKLDYISTNNTIINTNYTEIVSNTTNEDEFIDSAVKEHGFIKFHKNNIIIDGIGYEISDLYDPIKNTLYAVKRDFSTKETTHSFNQASLGIKILQDRTVSELEVLENNTINKELLKEVKNCRNITVLWIIDEEPQYMNEMMQNNDADLKMIKSLYVRIAIVEWFNHVSQMNYTPILAFATA